MCGRGSAQSARKLRAMTALADLFKAREVADPEQRNQLLRNVVAQLVKTHLRQSPAFAASATGLSTADDVRPHPHDPRPPGHKANGCIWLG